MRSSSGSGTDVRSRALVVYESMFGNTEAVAKSVALGLAHDFDVDICECASAPSQVPDDIDLLVVGAPTHAFSLSRASTRDSARQQAPSTAHPSERGLRDWLDGLEPQPRERGAARLMAASFDTKVAHPRLAGSAARAAAKKLHRLGMGAAVPPKNFLVEGTQGPLLDGEADAAFEWARGVADACLSSTNSASR